MTTPAQRYLQAYDTQLRTEAEAGDALSVTVLGPLRLVTRTAGRGFVTYQHLGDADAATIARWAGDVLDHFRADPAITTVKWKARGHDRAPGLREALVGNGFEPSEPDAIMIGEARLLAVDVPLPDGVALRRITAEADVRAMCAMQAEAFRDPPGADDGAAGLLYRQTLRDGMEMWVAEADGRIVGAGRLDPVRGTEFAGLWGGSTRQEWRGRGIYRALVAARARSALAMGKRLVHADSTANSQPLLERAGLLKVSTTMPYVWRR